MRWTTILTFACALGALATGCITTGTQDYAVPDTGDNTPWTHLNFRNNPDDFQFAIVSDRYGAGRPHIFSDAVEKLNMLQPEFVMSVGDLIDGYTEDMDILLFQHDEFDAEIAPLEMPFFRVVGNHDITNEVMADLWNERYGRSYYHFVYKNVLFLCLDTENPPGQGLSQDQIAYFGRALDENRDVRWTLVFMHRPLWRPRSGGGGDLDESNWLDFEALLQDRDYTVIAGHYHHYAKTERHFRDYYVLATTGGGSSLTGPWLGEFDHVVWVTMMDDGPRMANLALAGIFPDDVFTEELFEANLPTAPRSFDVLPVFAGPDGFREGTAVIFFENTSPFPVDVGLRLDAHPQLLLGLAENSFRVPPGAKHSVDLAMRSLTPLSGDVHHRVNGSANVAVDTGDGRVRTSTGPIYTGVLPRHTVPRARRPIVVDGDLGDWSKLPFVVDQPGELGFDAHLWQGPEDGRFRFGLQRDADFVYLAVEVMDATPVLLEGRYPWQQDGIEVRLCALPEPERSLSRGQGEFSDILLLAMAAGQQVEEAFGADRLPDGTQALSRVTATGHVFEAAIPASWLDSQQGRPWEAFRINITVNSYKTEFEGVQLWWQPDWRGLGTISGSGTFFRE